MLKTVAIVVGGTLSILCLMASLAGLTHLLWVQLVVALILGVGVPLILAERFGRDERGRGREGLATDLLATLWLGFAVIFFVAAFPYTRPLLAAEAEVLAAEGLDQPARVAAWLARERPLFGGTQGPRAADLPERADAAPTASDAEPPSVDAGPVPTDGGEIGDGAAGDGDLLGVDAEPQPAQPLPELTPGGIVDELSAAVVTLSIRRGDGRSGSATGLIVDRAGSIVTAASAVADMASVAVRIGDGTWLNATLRGRDAETGLAWLSIPSEGGLVEARQGDSHEVEVGAPLFIVANPVGLAPTLAESTLRGRREAGGISWLQLSTPVPSAALGAPVVNLRGEVVGLALSVGRDVVLPVTSLAVVEHGSGADAPASSAPRPMIW